MNPTPEAILRLAQREGVSVMVKGDQLVVSPEASPWLAAWLRCLKFELISLLNKEQAALQHLARQVLAGEFCGASPAQLRGVARRIGVKGIE